LGALQPASLQTLDIPSEFDRTHVFNVIGSFDLGLNWRVGARFAFYTGRPYTQQLTIARGGAGAFGLSTIPVPPFNSERMPAFYRLDLRIEKRWRVFKTGWVAFVIEGMNVTLSKEAITMQWEPTAPWQLATCTPQYIGPVAIPSIGAEGSL